jgi:hypothetical protein
MRSSISFKSILRYLWWWRWWWYSSFIDIRTWFHCTRDDDEICIFGKFQSHRIFENLKKVQKKSLFNSNSNTLWRSNKFQFSSGAEWLKKLSISSYIYCVLFHRQKQQIWISKDFKTTMKMNSKKIKKFNFIEEVFFHSSGS